GKLVSLIPSRTRQPHPRENPNRRPSFNDITSSTPKTPFLDSKRPSQMAKLAIFFTLTLSLLPFLSLSFSPESPTDRRILVLLDDFSLTSSHSIYFTSLKSRGSDLDFKLADDPNISLQSYGQYLYDGLILFAPSVEKFGGALDVAGVIDFVDSGHDLIIAADTSSSDLIKSIATGCGVDFDEEPSAMVIDHQSYAVSEIDGEHTLIAADEFIKSDVILGKTKIEAPVLFKGIGHSLSAANTLTRVNIVLVHVIDKALKVLSASQSAYSANPAAKLSSPPSLTGSAISLVSVVQARNNARIMITGSLDMLSNRYMKSSVQKAGSSLKYEKSGNEEFATELSKWVFHERGHLKAGNIRHLKVGETEEPAMYRIKDDIEFYVDIYEWSGNSWEPYVADDVQVQFYMMSPYVLKTLSTDKKGVYHTSFKVPDVYGVFQFKVEYQKLGYTSLSLSKQVNSLRSASSFF
ncbi:Dolichyl-diphosphooligosaccharide--protein glycosyltransferase 48 kDa subunit, partial [Linum perenne]